MRPCILCGICGVRSYLLVVMIRVHAGKYMPTVGRNEPCPCGSGKKYKRCCGSPTKRNEGVNTEKEASGSQTNFALSPMGIPGQQHGILVMNRFKDPKDPRNEGGPAGIAGKYKVIFTLCRPGLPLLPEYQFPFAQGLQGDSHPAITKPAFVPTGNPDADYILIIGSTDDGSFRFVGYPNAKGLR